MSAKLLIDNFQLKLHTECEKKISQLFFYCNFYNSILLLKFILDISIYGKHFVKIDIEKVQNESLNYFGINFFCF